MSKQRALCPFSLTLKSGEMVMHDKENDQSLFKFEEGHSCWVKWEDIENFADNQLESTANVCQCGKEKVGDGGKHSTWCAKYVDE